MPSAVGRWIAAALFVAGMFALDWYGPSVGIPPGESQQQGNYYSASPETETDPDTETGDDRIVKYTELLVNWTAVLGLCGIAGGIISMFQWSALRAQEARLKESIDKAEAAASQQSKDMQASVAMAEKSVEAATFANRAWIKISAEIIGPLTFKPSVALKVSITVENVGRSPATRVTVSTGIGVEPSVMGNDSKLVTGIKAAINKSGITRSERVVYDKLRTMEEIAELRVIGDVVFPREAREIPSHDWEVSEDELKYVLSESGGNPLVAVFYAVDAEYLSGNGWAGTRVVYAVEPIMASDKRLSRKERFAFRLFNSTKDEFRADEIVLRKLPIHTTAI